MALALFTFGVAGCGGSDASKQVDEYCDAVDAYVAKVKDVGTDPAKAADLTDEAQKLSEKAAKLADVEGSEEDAEALQKCTKEATDALLP